MTTRNSIHRHTMARVQSISITGCCPSGTMNLSGELGAASKRLGGDEISKQTEERQKEEHKMLGKENQNDEAKVEEEEQDERLCCACHRSLSKSPQLINVAGQRNRWHPECFRCSVCLEPMDRQSSCHLYKGRIVCRQDYARLQRDHMTAAKCARCRWPIGPSDWVRRAASHVYHLACFSCDICQRQLSTGEQFAVHSPPPPSGLVPPAHHQHKLLCRLHFAIEPPAPANSPTSSSGAYPLAADCRQLAFDGSAAAATSTSEQQQTFPSIQDNHQHHHFLHHLSAAGSSEQISAAAYVSEEAGEGGELQAVAGTSTGGSSTAGSTSGQLMSGGSKSKRVRTTFTEDQLSILQTHFQIDSNPDGQDLERIATITGLSKRVTQVWFQNSRARQKKYMIKRKPGGGGHPGGQATGLVGVACGGQLGPPQASQQFGQQQQQQSLNGRCQQWQPAGTMGSDQSDLSMDLGADEEMEEEEDEEDVDEEEELQSVSNGLEEGNSSNGEPAA